MKEYIVRPVMESGLITGDDKYHHKALLAMRATGLFVRNDPAFAECNQQLLSVASPAIPATMTYSDVVFENGKDGTVYVFSSEDQAQAEANFYATHARIEDHISEAVSQLAQIDHAERVDDGTNFDEALPMSGSSMLAAVKPCTDATQPERLDPVAKMRMASDEVMALYEGLDPDDFASFRRYFVGLNGYPGPSGLYTAAIPVLDLLLHGGSNNSPEETQHIKDNLRRGLYPRVVKGYVSSRLLGMLITLEPADVVLPIDNDLNAEMTNELDRFRRIHRASVKRFIPGAMEGVTAGSGGVTTVGTYLNSKMVNNRGASYDRATAISR